MAKKFIPAELANREIKGILTETEVTQIIESRCSKDTVEEVYGPTQTGDVVFWEVWVTDKDEDWATRFIEVFSDGRYAVYDTFQALCVRINLTHHAAIARREEAEWERAQKMAAQQHGNRTQDMKHIVGAAAFFIVVLVFAYAMLRRDTPSAYIAAAVFACLIASACYLFYGKFIEPEFIRRATEREPEQPKAEIRAEA
jgi:hypothetical protein